MCGHRCCCLYNPILHAARPDSGVDDDTLGHYAERIERWKHRGDRMLVILYVIHITLLLLVIVFVARWSVWTKRAIARYNTKEFIETTNPWAFMIVYVLFSEALNFILWFFKFMWVFLILYPIHRAMWHKGGTLCDYLLCRKSCVCVPDDPDKPLCVKPETTHISHPSLRQRPTTFGSVL